VFKKRAGMGDHEESGWGGGGNAPNSLRGKKAIFSMRGSLAMLLEVGEKGGGGKSVQRSKKGMKSEKGRPYLSSKNKGSFSLMYGRTRSLRRKRGRKGVRGRQKKKDWRGRETS